MQRKLIVIAVGLALLSPLQAQQAPAPEGDLGSVPITLVSANARVGLGINEDGDIHGEARGYFADDGDSIWFLDGWAADGGAGGLKLGLNWLWGADRADSIERPDQVTVAKSFIAVDQNHNQARKVSLGVGMERESWFGDLYVAGGITGNEQVDQSSSTITNVLTGVDAGRPYTQVQTIQSLLSVFEHPYETGVGARIGKYFDPYLLRISGGLDYEWGKFDSNQATISAGLEKYFDNSGHSLALNVEHYEKDGDFEIDKSDTRAWLTWRYEFGKRASFRAVEPVRMVEVKRDVEVGNSPGAGKQVVVKNEIGIDANAFFEFDRAEITAAGADALNGMLEAIKGGKRVSRVSIVGHTCDIGSDAYNQGLSERRANSVKQWLAAHDVEVDELDASGKGELEPRFPNTREERSKNRRVDVSFLTVEESMKEVSAPPKSESLVEWVREPVAVPAAWIERAMRNPAEHKRTVDVYRFETVASTTTLGPRIFSNQPPRAQNDTASTAIASPVSIPVLANDSDPDGDALSITSVTTPQNGSASISGSTITYIPNANFAGSDNFSYSISDGKGGTATATVTVTVNGQAPIANPDSAITRVDVPVTINVLANDRDPDGQALSVTAVSAPAHGTVTLNSDGSVRYTPALGYQGGDTFTYTLRDASGATATGVVTVTVTSANRAPNAVDDGYMLMFGGTLTMDLLANDSDPDGDAIRIISRTQPANGFVIEGSDGVLYYQSRLGFSGTDHFTYTIADADGLTDTATVTIMMGD